MKAIEKPPVRRLRFDSFELDLETGELQKNGRRVRLQDQPSRLLTLLANRAGELVTRSEIQKSLWEEGRFVEFDHAVNTAIKKVREALEDNSENPRIIETLPRKGYRFIAAVEWVEEPPASALENVSESSAETAPAPEAAIVVPDDIGTETPEIVAPVFQEPVVLVDKISPPVTQGRIPWNRVLLLVLILSVAAFAFLYQRVPTATPSPEMHVQLMTPPTADPTSVAISPDGMKIAFVAISDGRSQLRLRSLDSGLERSLPGTDGALFPFWSPNSRSIAFFADGLLKQINVDAGLPRVLAEAPAGRGGTWNADDVILYTPNTGGPVYRVSASGEGPAVAQTDVVGAGSHRHPRFLPDGRHFLYVVTGAGEERGVYVGDLLRKDPPRRLPVQADVAVEFGGAGYLFFVTQSALFAQSFDPRTMELSGDPMRVSEDVTVDAAMNRAAFSVSAAGTIIYRTGSGGAQRQLVWFDRRGHEIERVGEPDGGVLGPSLSPDGRHVAFYRTVDGNSDIWLMELERGVRERFTMDAAGEVNPVWSPDRRRIAFSSNRDGAYDLYVKSIASSETYLVLKTGDPKSASSWSPDGHYLLYRNATPGAGYDIWALPFDKDGKPGSAFPVAQRRSEEREAEFSPNGKWISYQSTASGRSEVYIQSFPDDPNSILLPVSTNGGAQPRWGSDSELFYIDLSGELMSVPIRYRQNGREISPEMPVPLFPTQIGGAVHSNDRQQYVVSPDGKRFLMNTLTETSSPIAVILNWHPAS